MNREVKAVKRRETIVLGDEIMSLNREYDRWNHPRHREHWSDTTTRNHLLELAACMSVVWHVARELGIEQEVREYVQDS